VNAIATKLAAELAPQTLGANSGYARREELLREFEELVMPNAEGVNYSQQYFKTHRTKFKWLAGRSPN